MNTNTETNKPSFLKCTLCVIVMYFAFNLAFNLACIVIDALAEVLSLFTFIEIIYTLVKSSGIILLVFATAFAIAVVNYIGIVFIDNANYESKIKIALGICLIIVNIYNIYCMTNGAEVNFQCIVFLISGIMYIIVNRKKKPNTKEVRNSPEIIYAVEQADEAEEILD